MKKYKYITNNAPLNANYVHRVQLTLLGYFALPRSILRLLSREKRKEFVNWMMAIHLDANDNAVKIPKTPKVVIDYAAKNKRK